MEVGGAAYRPSDAPLRHIYEAAAPWPSLLDAPLPEGEGQLLLDACELLAWERPRAAELLAGWIVVAPVCGALAWRPHLWLTGPAGSGKTWILNHLVLPMLEPLAIAVEGETTEAGIRQTLGPDARPIVFDEAETEKRSGQQRIQRVLGLARYMSSSGSGRVLKGGAAHSAHSFSGASCLLLVSINMAITRQADETRWTVVEIREPLDAAGEAFVALKAAVRRLDGTFRRRLLAATVANLATLRRNHATLAAAIGERVGARLGDQLGALMAGCHLLRSHQLIAPEDAARMAEDLPIDLEELAAIETDHERCLTAICSLWVRVDTAGGKRQVTRTIGDLIALRLGLRVEDELGGLEVDLALARHGVAVKDLGPWLREVRKEGRRRVMPPDWRDFLAAAAAGLARAEAAGQAAPRARAVFVANRHPTLARLLLDTDFADSWARVLARLPGAVVFPGSVRFGPGVQQRATVLPAELFVGGTEGGTSDP